MGVASGRRRRHPQSGAPVLFVHGNDAGADWSALTTPVAEFARLAECAGDVLVIWGDNDAYIGLDQAEEQRQLFHGGRMEVIAECGHWPWLEEPDVVAGHLTGFLRG